MKRFVLFAVIVLVLLLIALLVFLFVFMRTKPDSDADSLQRGASSSPGPDGRSAPAQQTGALASEELPSGLIAEVVRVARGKDGLVEVRWRYRNPTDKPITLCSNDEGKRLAAGVYCSSGGEKHTPVEFPSGKRLASEIGWTTVPPGKAVLFWAKFDVPAENPHVAFFVPGLLLPMEDLPVGADEPPSVTETPADVLAAGAHVTGLMVEVLRVRRTPEDLVEVRWRYRNPTDQHIHLFSSTDAEALPSRVFLVDDAARSEYPVHRDADGVPTASRAAFTTLAPGKSVTFFARFPAPPETSRSMTFYVPDTPPLADLTIE